MDERHFCRVCDVGMNLYHDNLIELHAPMNNKRAVLDNRLQNGTVFPNIHLIY